MTRRSVGVWIRITVAVLLAAMSGCIYVPPLYNVDEQCLDVVEIGVTTRAELETWFGTPDVLDEERFQVWTAVADAGHVIVGIPFLVHYEEGPVGEQTRYRLLARTDGADRVVRWDMLATRLDQWETEDEHAARVALSGRRTPLLMEKGFLGSRRSFTDVAVSRHRAAVAVLDQSGRAWIGDGRARGFSKPTERKTDLLDLSPDGTRLVCAKGSDVSLLSVPDGSTVFEHTRSARSNLWTNREAMAVKFSGDGARVAVAFRDGIVQILATADGALRHEVDVTSQGWISSLAWAPDDDAWASAGFHRPVEIRSESGAVLFRRPVDELDVYPSECGVAFAPDGRRLAINVRTHVEIWRLPAAATSRDWSAAELDDILPLPAAVSESITGHPIVRMTSVAFSPDGSLLAASAEGQGVCYELITKELIWWSRPSSRARFVPDFQGGVTALAFDHGGRGMYVAYLGGVDHYAFAR